MTIFRSVTYSANGHLFTQKLFLSILMLFPISGTHETVASSFSDGKSIEATVEALVNDPNLLNTEVNFALTVFLASPPGDPKGYPRIWSMNNRRLKAMQLASKRMRNSDPEVRIKWASESDINYAVQAGKWMNINGGEVEFHSTQSRIRRRVDIATNQAPSTVSASDVKKALNDPQALRDLLGL